MSINKPQRDFAKDRAICEAATPGPWMNDNLSNSLIWGPKGPGFGLIAKANYGILWRDNARFIAEARTGWPAALDEIERLRAALEWYALQTTYEYIKDESAPILEDRGERARKALYEQALSTTKPTGAERVRELWALNTEEGNRADEEYLAGIVDTLNALGIKIPGINAPGMEGQGGQVSG